MRFPTAPLFATLATASLAAAVAALLALPAAAQPVPAPPDGCDAFRPFGGAAPPPDDSIAEPGFGGIFVTSPPSGAIGVPRNVEVRLGGDVNALEVEPAQMSVQLLDPIGARVPFERDGLALRPLAPLAPRQTFIVRIEATDANPCPDCFGVQELPFTTGEDIDTEPPTIDGDPPVHVFVLPNGPEAEACGVFFGQTHTIVVDFGPQLPLNTFITVAAKKEGDTPRTLFESFNNGQVFPAQSNVGATVPTALGDVFFVAITPRDLAGNVGNARVVRVRARSFIDQQVPRDQLSSLWCDMPASPVVSAAATLPTNGQIAVAFPFEEVPVALRPVDGGDDIPLVPVSDTTTGNVYRTAVPMPEGAAFDVVGLPCTQCVCEGCAFFEPQRVEVGAGTDTTPPGAPEVVELREDAAPSLSVEEQCRPDRPALLAVLAPGADDQTDPLDLRYDANIAIDGQPPVVLGRALAPEAGDDGTVVVRIETNGFGRVLGEPFELTLEAIDAAGNRAASTTAHGQPEETGCAAAGATSAPAGALALALALLRRRRR